MNKPEISISEWILVMRSVGSLAGIIGGCFLGLFGGIYDLKMTNLELKKELANIDEYVKCDEDCED